MRAIIIAPGPSLTQKDVETVRRFRAAAAPGTCRVTAIKEAVELCMWADVLYAADDDWWRYNEGYADFAGERWTVHPRAAFEWGIKEWNFDVNVVWSERKGVLATGFNSGFQALNLAYLKGASEIVMLGFDLCLNGTQRHFYTNERPKRNSNYERWIHHYNLAAPLIKIPVFNASRRTALKCFPRVDLDAHLRNS